MAGAGGLDADLLILGAGCAGLSLAWHLLDRGLGGRRLLLVDPRERYDRDRTWCYWSVAATHPFDELVSHRWARWRVRDDRGGDWIERGSDAVAYHHLPADAFYARVLDRLAGAADVELRLGVRAEEVCSERRLVRVRTDDGPLRARVAFDSRPPSPRGAARPGRDVRLLQHFEGWHVQADGAAFDAETVTLMDFAVSQAEGIHFFYVLPYAPDEALVEATWFGIRTALTIKWRVGAVIGSMLQSIMVSFVLESIVQPPVLPPSHRVTMGLPMVQLPMKVAVLQFIVIATMMRVVRGSCTGKADTRHSSDN